MRQPSTRLFFAIAPLMAVLIGCGGGDEKNQTEANQPEAKQPRIPQVAQVGVGKKGSKLRKRKGVGKMVASSAVAYFNTKEKIAFEIQIPHALRLFNATNGRNPRSHKAFMEKIIKPNQIALPQLPEDAKYEYRPKDGSYGQLWVVPK